jgi:hypothetical protein
VDRLWQRCNLRIRPCWPVIGVHRSSNSDQ